MTDPPSISFLCNAWNCFVRLLDHSPTETLICPLCGPQTDIIVCDGTMLGFRKDLLPSTQDDQPDDDGVLPTIKGSKHADRVLLHLAKSREFLLKYSGYTSD